jgi:hypothetical protein
MGVGSLRRVDYGAESAVRLPAAGDAPVNGGSLIGK